MDADCVQQHATMQKLSLKYNTRNLVSAELVHSVPQGQFTFQMVGRVKFQVATAVVLADVVG